MIYLMIGQYTVVKEHFYDKFDIEFLKFKSEIISKLGDFIKEKQFSDKDELLLREYLDTLGIENLELRIIYPRS